MKQTFLILIGLAVNFWPASLASAQTELTAWAVRPAPVAVRELKAPVDIPPGIRVRRFLFELRSRDTPAGPVMTEVYAFMALPEGMGPFPGLLVMHGGKGHAEEAKAIAWAKRGYVAIAPDLPYIANPETASESKGAWKAHPYAWGRWDVKPDVTHGGIFEAVITGLDTFKLLQAQPEVDRSRIGIVGISWGGYVTTILSGLLGEQVAVAFSVFGCGHYEKAVFAHSLGKMPEIDRKTWMETLDASRYAPKITAPYFIAAATNDSFFFPPAVLATLDDIQAPKNWVFIPNADHKTSFPGGRPADPTVNWAAMEVDYFDYYLKGKGKALPVISVPQTAPDGNRVVRFHVESELPLEQVSVYVTGPDDPWKDKTWQQVPANLLGGGNYESILPETVAAKGFWMAVATDNRPVSVSSRIYACGDADLARTP